MITLQDAKLIVEAKINRKMSSYDEKKDKYIMSFLTADEPLYGGYWYCVDKRTGELIFQPVQLGDDVNLKNF